MYGVDLMVDNPNFELFHTFQLSNQDNFTRFVKVLNCSRYIFNKNNITHEDFIISRDEKFKAFLHINKDLFELFIVELVNTSFRG
jgi:hypothetical protein